MAATTISGYSVGLNQGPPGSPQLYAPMKPNEHYGRIRVSTFRLVFASQAAATSFALAIIPKGARLIKGTLAASATLANSATLAVGLAAYDGSGVIHPGTAGGYDTTNAAVTSDVSDGTALLKAAAAQGATQVDFCLTQALGYLYETQKQCYLTITTGTGAVTTEVLTGHITYVVD